MKNTQLGAIALAQLVFLTTVPVNASAALRGPAPGQEQQAAMQTGPMRLEDGTPIKLRLSRTLSSASAQVDERVDFDVLEEVKVGDLVVIPKGAIAWGTVTEAKPKGRMGHAGKLAVNIDSVRLANGEKAALRGVKEVKGGSHTGAMTGAIVATSLIVWPAAPFFLFMHGKDITIPKGTELSVYINGDVPIDPAKFGVPAAPAQPAAATTTPAAAAQAATDAKDAELSTVIVKSTPDGADIVVDGKYVGSTPSTIRLAPGDHAISVEKAGFTSWQRTMTAGSGSIVTVDATLQKVQ
jgi:PEGA domain